jgi:hypothetical protein
MPLIDFVFVFGGVLIMTHSPVHDITDVANWFLSKEPLHGFVA